MALIDQRKPYEILIRFGMDGEPQGAHVQYRRIVTLDGEILKDQPEPAVPLGLEDFPTSGLMNEVTEAALAEVTRLSAALEEVRSQLRSRSEDAAALEAQITHEPT